MRTVYCKRPEDIRSFDDVYAQVELETAGTQFTDVLQQRVLSRHGIRDRSSQQQVGRVGLVPVQRTVKAVPEAEVESDIDRFPLLPGQGRVGSGILGQFPTFRSVRTRCGVTRRTVRPGLVAAVSSDTALVADHAVVGTDLQVGQPAGSALHPVFGRDTPCTADAPEDAPAFVHLFELRGTVGTDRSGQVVFVVVDVVGAPEVTFQCLLVLTAADAGEGTAAVQVDEVGERIEAVDQGQRALVVQALVIHPVEFMTDDSVHVVFTVVVAPIQGLLRVDCVCLMIVTPHHTLFGAGRFAVFLGQVDVAHAVGLIVRHTGIEGEVLEEFGLHVTDRRDVVLDVFRFGVIHLVLQVITGRFRSTAPFRYDGTYRRVLLIVIVDHLFVSFRVVHHVTLRVALVDRCQRIVDIGPGKYVLHHGARVTGTVTAVLHLGRPAAVRHVQSGFQPFGHLGIDV